MKNPQVIDPEITKNHSFETVFIIDNHAPQAFNGGYIPHQGNFNESLILFPFISEYFLNGHKKTIEVIGESDTLTYRLSGANNVHLTVNYESDMFSYWTGVKEKKEGNKTVITYPNGEEERKSKSYPDYKKLLKIYEERKNNVQH